MKFGLADSSSSESETPLPLDPPLTRRSPVRKRTPWTVKSPARANSDNNNSKPFAPAPVQLRPVPNPAKAALKFRSRVVPIADDDSSDDDQDDHQRDLSSTDLDSEDEPDLGLDSDDDDSEEEQWPVGPVGSVGVAGWRTRNGRTRRDIGRAHGGPDPLELWDAKAKQSSWAQANRSFHLSLARSMSASPPPVRDASEDMTSIQSLLSDLKLQQANETNKLVQSFDTRNKALWSSIEAAILHAEREEGERQRVLAEKRRQQEEAERKAKEMREAEQKKAEEEQRRKAQEREAKGNKHKQEQAAKAEMDKQQKEAAAQARRTASIVAPPAGSGVEGSPQAEYERWAAVMSRIKQNVLPAVSQNADWRKQCFTAKRAITPKIGQLTSSSETTSRIIGQLDQILASMRAPTNAAGPSEPYTWTLNHLSKALVKQAETEVTAKLQTAYPLGRVVVGLLTRGHTELGEVLMARLVKKCFWITGWWPPKQQGQSEDDHRKALGHAPTSSNETLVQYAQRMSGIIALYASITQTSPSTPPQGPCPADSLANVPAHFRPSAGWRWLVLILRPPLVTLEPTPLLLVTFLEIAGAGYASVFGRQFHKFLDVLLREGVRDNKAGFSDKAKSSTVRLTLWLEDWEKNGKVEEVAGRVPDP